MILWTIQSLRAVRVLGRRGVLSADGSADITAPFYEPTYRWMAAQMRDRIGPAPSHDSKPLWAWHTWQGKRHPPDLRSKGHLLQGERGARIEFELPELAILLSDFSLWHYALNYWYLPCSRTDEKTFQATLDRAGLNFFRTKPLPNSTLHRRIERSWERMFDLGFKLKGVTDDPGDRSIQATTWSIPSGAIRSVREFTAR